MSTNATMVRGTNWSGNQYVQEMDNNFIFKTKDKYVDKDISLNIKSNMMNVRRGEVYDDTDGVGGYTLVFPGGSGFDSPSFTFSHDSNGIVYVS